MEELHALVDFENVQPTLDELAKFAPGFTDLWLFHGPHQAKQAQHMAAAHSGVTLVPHSGKGKNALDFHLFFYLGYVAAEHPDAHLVVVANDTGYDPMIAHARILKFTISKGQGVRPRQESRLQDGAGAANQDQVVFAAHWRVAGAGQHGRRDRCGGGETGAGGGGSGCG